jgi:hypothetical protein
MRLLADTPVSRPDQGCLGYPAHADAVAEPIDSEATDAPVVRAITGASGRRVL